MAIVFDNLSDGFYTAFFEPDPEKRRIAIDLWIKSSVPIIQSAVEEGIRAYLEPILKDTWTSHGWKSRATKFTGLGANNKQFIDSYKLCLELRIKQPDEHENNIVINSLTTETRANTIRAIENIASILDPEEKKKKDSQNVTIVNESNQDYDDDTVDERSPNDDRSDSMNPNNDSYHASMDNHSNQMNPNNDTYWSSRGH
jgi:hypothetical protein